MRLGFTGTRETPTDPQIACLIGILEEQGVEELHHGACVGADAYAHQLALDAGLRIHVWPPTNMKLCATQCLTPTSLVTVHPRMPYLTRNREIVGATSGLVAVPKQDQQPQPTEWGGTWYTVDFAQRMNKPVVIVWPSGVAEQRHSL